MPPSLPRSLSQRPTPSAAPPTGPPRTLSSDTSGSFLTSPWAASRTASYQMKAPLTLCFHNLSAPGTSVGRPSFKLTLQGHSRDQATALTAPCEATCNSGHSPWPFVLRPALVLLWPPGHCDNQNAGSPAHHVQMQGRSAFRDSSAEAQFSSGVAPTHHTLPEDVGPHPRREPPHGLSTSPQEPLGGADWTPQ